MLLLPLLVVVVFVDLLLKCLLFVHFANFFEKKFYPLIFILKIVFHKYQRFV